MSTLTPLELLALSRVRSDRDAVTPGVQAVDFTVHVSAEIVVGEDTEKIPTVSIPLKEVLALFIARAGVTRDASVALLRECMSIALALGPRGQGAIDSQIDIDEVFSEAVDKLTASLPRTPVRGQVRVRNLTVTKV